MPKISQFTTASAPSLSDKLIGTSVGGTPSNLTNNFTLQEIKDLFDGGPTPPSPTLQSVLNAGNTAIQNIYLTGELEAIDLTISNDASSKNLYLSERFYDKNNSSGTSGQYLTSTGGGVQWSTLTIPIPTLQQVLTAGNVSDKNITTTGNIQGSTITGTNLIANSNLRVVGTLSDSTNSVGASGQVLSSTVTGTDWVDLPSYSAVSPLIYNNVLKQFSIQQATSTQNGYLSSADWITFDGKQNAGNYITALTGEATASGPGSATITLNNLAVINKTLVGFSTLSGVVTSADSIISAFGKIQGQLNNIIAGVVYQGVWNAATNTPTLVSGVGVKGNYYVVDVAGNTNLDGITDWQVGDWAIFNGDDWQKVDNTDSVTSVNGQVGTVVLTTDNINEGTTNLYYTNTRARNAISSLATGLTYTAGTGIFSLTAGYSIPTIANQTDWTTAYNDSIVSAAVTGTTTKTLTLTQQDGGTITANWTDLEGLTSVGVTMPSAFNVSNTPLTSNGTIAITGAGTTGQYIDGTGALQSFPSLTGFVPYIGATQAVELGYNGLYAGKLLVDGPSAMQGGFLGFKQSTNVIAGEGSYTSVYAFGSNYLGFKFPQSPSGYRDFGFDVSSITPNVPGGRVYTMPDADGTLALTSDIPSITNLVPYTGANQNVNLGTYGLLSDFVQFNLAPTSLPTVQGTMYWDADKETIDVILNGTTGSIFQDTFFFVKNQTGASIPKGTVVRANGTVGASGRILATPFLADGSFDSKFCLGVTTELINNGEDGRVTYFGSIRGINTSMYPAGTVLYASPSVVGGFTATEPIGPTNNIISVAIVVNSSVNNGSIFVRPTFIPTALDIAKSLNYTPANQATTLTINGTTYDLSANRSWSVGTVTSVATTGPITGGTITGTGTIGITQATATIDGYLSSTDWVTFNSKQNAITLTTTGTSGASTLIGSTLNIPVYQAQGNYITALTGEATASGPGSASITLSNSAVTGKVLTGLNVTGSAILDTDSILVALGKLQNQVNQLVGGLKYDGTWNAATNTPTITSGVGTDGDFYIVNVAGTTSIDGINDWQVGDWIVFHTPAWQKVDNSDSVSSVFGRVGNITAAQSDYSAFYPLIADIKNGVLTVQGDGVLGGSGTFSANQATNATISITHDAVSRTNTTSTQSPSFGGTFTAIDSITSSTEGHITAVNTKTVTIPNTTSPNNATITLSAGSGISGGGDFTTDQSFNETITFSHGATSSQPSVNNSGRTFIQDVTLDAFGHVTGLVSATDSDTFTGTVTSVSGTGGYGGLTLSGTVTTSGNITLGGTPSGTWPINISGDAATVDGFSASQSTLGNHIVVRDPSGYIFGNYINMTDDGNPGGGTSISSFITKQGDNYYRSVSPANAMASIRANASGTWPISIAGSAFSAGTATTLSSGWTNWSGTGVINNVVGMLAWKNYGNSHVIFDASQSTSPTGGGCNNTNPNVPWTGTYPTLMGFNGSNTYGVRVDSARTSDQLDGYSSSSYVGQFGNSYYQVNTWLQLNGSYGLYWPYNYGAHLHANDLSSYTQIALRGSKNGYGGIHDQYSGVTGYMYDSAGNGGVYREGNGRWYFYYHLGNDCMGIGTSNTSSAYSLYLNKGIYAQSNIIVANMVIYGSTYFANIGNVNYGPNSSQSVGLHIYNQNNASNDWTLVSPTDGIKQYSYGYEGYLSPYAVGFNLPSGGQGGGQGGGGYASYQAGGLNGYNFGNFNNFSFSADYVYAYSGTYNEGIRWESYSFGDLYIGGVLYQNQWSDAKYKDNVSEIENALDKLNSIRGVEYDWNQLAFDETGREGHDVGVIAQDVQAVYPFAVREVDKEKNDYVQSALVVDYEKIIPLLIQSIKELSIEIEKLKSK
jgi:hypothetical protein